MFTDHRGHPYFQPAPAIIAPFEADLARELRMTIHQRRDDWPNPWRIQVRAHPARRESISWREAIRDAVTATYPEAPFPSPPWGTKFTVEVSSE